MAANKTVPTGVSAEDFIATLPSERRRAEALILLPLFARASGEPAVMWGPSMIGFGEMHYRTAAGREGDCMIAGFSPRKAALSLYGLHNAYAPDPALEALGSYTTAVSCVYVKRLSDIDLEVLERLVRSAFHR